MVIQCWAGAHIAVAPHITLILGSYLSEREDFQVPHTECVGLRASHKENVVFQDKVLNCR